MTEGEKQPHPQAACATAGETLSTFSNKGQRKYKRGEENQDLRQLVTKKTAMKVTLDTTYGKAGL